MSSRSSFFSGKRGVITFVFSKVSLMIFVVMMTMAFFFAIHTINDIRLLNEKSAVADSIVNVVSSVSASSFETSVVFSHKDYDFSLKPQGLEMQGLNTNFLFPINYDDSDKELNTGCFVVHNLDGTVIEKCQ